MHPLNHLTGEYFITVGKLVVILKHLMMLCGTRQSMWWQKTISEQIIQISAIYHPNTYDDSIGYHSQYHNDITTISTSAVKRMLCSRSSQKLSTSHMGVFSADLILSVATRLLYKVKIESLGACMTDESELASEKQSKHWVTIKSLLEHLA